MIQPDENGSHDHHDPGGRRRDDHHDRRWADDDHHGARRERRRAPAGRERRRRAGADHHDDRATDDHHHGPGAPAQPEPVQLTSREDDKADATVTLQDKDGEGVYQLGPALATGQIVSSARAEIPQGQWLVALSMKGGADGIDKFNEIAAQCNPPSATCPTGRLAIVLDSVVQSAPTINEPSYSKDDITISGSFTEGEAKDLALVLRYGSLPVELERQSVQTVSASLGEDSLRAGIIAGVVGLVLVALYMLLYYRALGVVMIVGVGISGALLYSIVSWLGETRGLALTLAGVTGIIVSIGVTVDSYVVFFERLKDEVKAGRTLRTSTERAFNGRSAPSSPPTSRRSWAPPSCGG